VLFARGLVNIPSDATLLRELRLLERRVARSGKDSVDHGVSGTDDFANALFGALYIARQGGDFGRAANCDAVYCNATAANSRRFGICSDGAGGRGQPAPAEP